MPAHIQLYTDYEFYSQSMTVTLAVIYNSFHDIAHVSGHVILLSPEIASIGIARGCQNVKSDYIRLAVRRACKYLWIYLALHLTAHENVMYKQLTNIYLTLPEIFILLINKAIVRQSGLNGNDRY